MFENSAFLSQRASKEQSENRFKFVQSIEPLRGLQVRNQMPQKISGSHSKSSAGHLQPLLLPHVRKTRPLKPSFLLHLSAPFPRGSPCMSSNQKRKQMTPLVCTSATSLNTSALHASSGIILVDSNSLRERKKSVCRIELQYIINPLKKDIILTLGEILQF